MLTKASTKESSSEEEASTDQEEGTSPPARKRSRQSNDVEDLGIIDPDQMEMDEMLLRQYPQDEALGEQETTPIVGISGQDQAHVIPGSIEDPPKSSPLVHLNIKSLPAEVIKYFEIKWADLLVTENSDGPHHHALTILRDKETGISGDILFQFDTKWSLIKSLKKEFKILPAPARSIANNVFEMKDPQCGSPSNFTHFLKALQFAFPDRCFPARDFCPANILFKRFRLGDPPAAKQPTTSVCAIGQSGFSSHKAPEFHFPASLRHQEQERLTF